MGDSPTPGSAPTQQPSPPITPPPPAKRPNLHTAATEMWMAAANGGYLPKPGQPDKAVDSLGTWIENINIDPANPRVPTVIPPQTPVTEAAVNRLAADAAAQLSMTDPVPEPPKRCWTNGTDFCSCVMPARYTPLDGMWDGTDVVCGMDCPKGHSQEELAAAAAQMWDRHECILCGQAECICVAGSVVHEYDPFCMRPDCTCMNHIPWNPEIMDAMFRPQRETADADVEMGDVEEGVRRLDIQGHM